MVTGSYIFEFSFYNCTTDHFNAPVHECFFKIFSGPAYDPMIIIFFIVEEQYKIVQSLFYRRNMTEIM